MELHHEVPLDAWHFFELMDRSSVLEHLFDFSIASHPVADSDDELRALIEQIGDLLGDLYQRAGVLLDERLDDEEA